MTENQKRGRASVLFAITVILTFMGAMVWLHARHGRGLWVPCIGFVALAVSCWLLWRGWKPAYLALCGATGLGALIALAVSGRSASSVFAVGMNGFAFVNLMLPVTRSFLAEQKSKYSKFVR
jgi:hypothetical protein